MLPKRLAALAAIAALITATTTEIAAAQAADTPQSADEVPAPDEGTQAEQPDAMPGDMMRAGRMRSPGMRMARGMPMHGHMMKIMFAIADADGDGALSFEEISAIHKRIFDRVDADKDGKVTPEEIRAFMQE